MKKYIEKLHFITHNIPQSSHVEQVQVACEAGAKWIQYRCLSKADDELLADINAIAEICDDWGATLIVTNHIHLKDKADIQGFHIEDMDADFIALRKQIGEEFTLGGSANTIENLIRLANEGADYAGFGPFKVTTTKPNDYPLLGVEGYVDAIEKSKAKNIHLPILAVGGVTLADIRPLLDTGIYGIAASSAINQAENMYEAYLDFYKAII
ncbi:thiamine phosphate synthase [Pedobacter frigiditerrae]|uniref:Thiamine phosphate synthase n=1 Tax=Pedobacter frigiditerrae TaxID=2530452 RepID=A0A4R0N2J2_9SPHI|nr:thiamine phosphate synthase [Pedobacter frigiditerrae]TCC93567.1 thiamine phosphate synthase [Pedobacter frigiditerrae]